MNPLAVAIIGILTTACSSPAFVGDDAGDTSDTCPTENGSAACQVVISSWCGRIVQCCTAAGSTACQSWAYTVPDCEGHYLAAGFDCAAPSWTSRTVCQNIEGQCTHDVPLVACSDLIAGTANIPASCTQ